MTALPGSWTRPGRGPLLAVALAAAAGCPPGNTAAGAPPAIPSVRFEALAPEGRPPFLDVTLGELYDIGPVGRLGAYPSGLNGLSAATTSCNTGEVAVRWDRPMEETHPFIGLALFREKDGVLEMIGRSWLKHGFLAAGANQCGLGCGQIGGNFLDVGCSDTYSAKNNGSRLFLGPRHEVNPYTGEWEACGSFFDGVPEDCFQSYFGNEPNEVNHRLVVADSDLGNLDSDGSPARYFYEGEYIVAGDGDPSNNIGWRECTTTWQGFLWSFRSLGPGPFDTPNYGPLVQSWGDEQVTRRLAADDGEVVLATRVTENAGGWHYEYALYNWRSDRGVRSFAVPVGSAALSNVAFRDIDTDAGNDWAASAAGGTVSWETAEHAADPDAPALFFQTLFNFRFDADLPPAPGVVTLGIFKPGIGDVLFLDAPVPATGVPLAGAAARRGPELHLGANEPNPFSSSTRLRFSAGDAASLRLTVWDVTGRRIRVLVDGAAPRGPASVNWDGTDAAGAPVASGIYFFRLETAGGSRTVRGTLLR
jgi:hypothetical protein